MTRTGLPFAFLCALFAVGALFSTSVEAHKAIFLVRHAEKESQTDPDSAISVIGEDRALAFARLVRNAGVTHVFVSDKKRTAQTAEPVTMQRGLTPVVAKDNKDLVEKIKAAPKDAVIVVVGHSNTIPEILKALGVKDAVAIKEDQFGRVFVVTADNAMFELAY